MQVTAISSALVLAACGAGGESVTNESNGGGAVSADIGVIS